MRIKCTLAEFHSEILPKLAKEVNGDADQLKKKAALWIDDNEVTDADGNPVSAESISIVTMMAEPADEAPSEEVSQETAKSIASAVAKALDPVAKNFNRILEGHGNPNRGTVPATPKADEGKGGYKHFGEFLDEVRVAAKGIVPDRLKGIMSKAPTTVGSTTVGADGGFAVPTDFAGQIFDLTAESPEAVLPLTSQFPLSGNAIDVPTDEDALWSSNGISASNTAEGAQQTQTKPLLDTVTLKLRKKTVLIPVTDELLNDSTAMGAYVQRKGAQKLNFAVEQSFFSGSGVNEPLGVFNAASTIAVSAGAISLAKLAAMVEATLTPLSNYRWYYHPSEFSLLIALETANGAPLFFPPGGLTGSPFATIMGIPAIMSQHMVASGASAQSLMLADWSGYMSAVKAGQGVVTSESPHVWFDYDVHAFKMSFRVDGQPGLTSAVAARSGAGTHSHFITLAAS